MKGFEKADRPSLLFILFPLLISLCFPVCADLSKQNPLLTNSIITTPETLIVNTVMDSDYILSLGSVSQVLLDPNATMRLDQVIASKNFENTKEGQVIGYSADQVFWYRFILKNNSDASVNLVFKTNRRTVIDASLYQLDQQIAFQAVHQSGENTAEQGLAPDKIGSYQTFGDYQSFNDRVIQARKYSVPVRLPANSEQHFYLRWVNEGQAAYNMQVVDVSTFFSQQMTEQAFMFLTLGFSFSVLLYCAMIYWKTKEKLYSSFMFYIIGFSLFIEVHSGGVAMFWPEIIPGELLGRFLWTSAFLTLLTFSRFSAHFLSLEDKFPELNSGINYFQVFCLLFVVSSFFIPYKVVEMSVYIMVSIIVPFTIYASIVVLRKYNDSASKIYLLSFSPVSIYILFLAAVYAFELYEFPYTLEGIRASFVLNLLLLSTALANQISVMAEKQQIYESKLIAAAASEAAKNEFFGKMSHEIRTPLSGVLGVSQLLQDTELDEQQKKYIDILNASSRALIHFVDNILDYSKAEAGKMPLEKVSFDLETMLLDVERVFVLKTFESQVPLLFEVQESIPRFLRGDANRIRQILINLVANAYKFTSAGVIRVKVFQDASGEKKPAIKDKFCFEVIDTGIGIPAAQIDSIFEDFTQVYSANSRRYGGAGLGLAICRELSKLLGGEIGLESEVGKGSRFWVTLPLERVDMDEETTEYSLHKRRLDFRIIQNETLVSKTLLFIDACAAYREQVDHVARAWGLKAGVAATLSEGLAKIRTANDVDVEVDLIVLDYRCLQSDEGGNHFLAALERHPAARNSAIIILTSQASIAARFHVSRKSSAFIAQRPAFVYKLQETFIAAVSRDESFFERNRPLFDNHLTETVDEVMADKQG